MKDRLKINQYFTDRILGLLFVVLLTTGTSFAQGTVKADQKISDTQGSFTGTLDDDDEFGQCVASIGDLDGDGVTDIVVGAKRDDDKVGGGSPVQDRGAVWILFMNTNGTVKSHQKISDTQGNFSGGLDKDDYFGSSVASLNDLDGDNVTDIVVGAYGDDDGGSVRGALWILFLNTNGTVKSYQKISDTQGGFTGILDDFDFFGMSVTSIGDLDGDNVTDIVVGADRDSDGGTTRGAVWILFLNTNGTVKSHQKISDTQGNFTGVLDDYDAFGNSIASLGDLDGDGITDIAVGSDADDDGGSNRGCVWILFLNSDGTVKSYQKISDTQGNFTGTLANSDRFGNSVASLGDLDGDGITDITVGAEEDDDDGTDRGAIWNLFLNTDGTVKSHQKISDTLGGFTGILDNSDQFGRSLTSLGDLDGDGKTDIAVGAYYDDDGGTERGAIWILLLDAVVLPIELLSFDAKPDGEMVNILWETASEINNDFFTIERSRNGIDFEVVTTIKGAGNSYSVRKHGALDLNPYPGISYYRLKQTDEDGQFSYSDVVSITFINLNGPALNVYPNPVSVSSNVNIEFNNPQDEEVLLVLYDPLGAMVYSKVLMNPAYRMNAEGQFYTAIDLSNRLKPGIYLIIGFSHHKDIIAQKKLIIR